jgi:hypothetical protein
MLSQHKVVLKNLSYVMLFLNNTFELKFVQFYRVSDALSQLLNMIFSFLV